MIKTYTDAMAAGYRVTAPDQPSKTLAGLCSHLGPEYHLAMIDGCNVIHRVIGDGWDVEIWRAGRRRYNITLWKGYGRESVISETDIPDQGDAVKCIFLTLLMILNSESPTLDSRSMYQNKVIRTLLSADARCMASPL